MAHQSSVDPAKLTRLQPEPEIKKKRKEEPKKGES